MFYPILVDAEDNVTTITKDEYSRIYDNSTKQFDDHYLDNILKVYKKKGCEIVLPYVDSNHFGRWRWGYNENTINRLSYDVIVTRTKNGISLYKKQRPELGELPSKKPKSIFYKPEYSSGNGTMQLKDIMNGKVFNNPKPLELIKDIITIATNKRDAIILDFTAGSGTTLHAILELNSSKGYLHSGILITNNENNICEEITYERNKKIIMGYKNSKAIYISGLNNNNLRYYKSEFVNRKPTLKNKIELTQLATELLCIKENCYYDYEVNVPVNGKSWLSMFHNGKEKYLTVIYDDTQIPEAVEFLQKLIETKQPENDIKVYVFSNGQYPYTEEFEPILAKITLCALPDAIYKAYQNVLPKRKRDVIPEIEEPTTEELEKIIEENDLFN